MRYKLEELYDDASQLVSYLKGGINTAMSMGLTATTLNELYTFIGNVIFGYFYEDLVAYNGDTTTDVKSIFILRVCNDINIKLPYWYKKYNYVKKLLTTDDFSLLQTSKMTSSSTDNTLSAGGSLQKVATTPTGVTADGSIDSIDITITPDSNHDSYNEVETTGFVDKYTNTQQKYVNSANIKGERSGEIMREGSIDELLNVLEKLPSSFANEINIVLQKHFIFDYEGEVLGYYDE